MKYSLVEASPEEIKKKQEDADRAMRELLDEEEKKPTLYRCLRGKQAKTDKVRHRYLSQIETGVVSKCLGEHATLLTNEGH